jgi:hypothetical protein
MQRELRDLMNLIAALEQVAGGLVPQIVKAQVLDAEDLAGARERRADALGVVGKDVFACPRLAWTISGRMGSSLTLLAALRTTPSQIRSLTTVAGPVPAARRAGHDR